MNSVNESSLLEVVYARIDSPTEFLFNLGNCVKYNTKEPQTTVGQNFVPSILRIGKATDV